MYGLTMQWWRCRQGVELYPTSRRWGRKVEEVAENQSDLPSFLGGGLLSGNYGLIEVEEPEFRCASADLGPVLEPALQPSNLEKPVVQAFVNARTDEKRVAFLARFGFPLGRSATPSASKAHVVPRDGMTKSLVELVQDRLRNLVMVAGGRDQQLAVHAVNDLFSRVEYEVAPSSALPMPVMPGQRDTDKWLPVPLVLRPTLEFHRPQGKRKGPGEPRLLLRPQTLEQFMAMECALIALQGARAAACENCEDIYLVGPLTRRRAVGHYCSDRCRIYALRKRRAIATDP